MFGDKIITNFLWFLTVKQVWKLVNIWWSYKTYKNVSIFGATLYTNAGKSRSEKLYRNHYALTYIGRICTDGRRDNVNKREIWHSSVVRWFHHRRRHLAGRSAL